VANFTLTVGWMGSNGGLCAFLRRILRRCRPQDAIRGLMRRMGTTPEMVRWEAVA